MLGSDKDKEGTALGILGADQEGLLMRIGPQGRTVINTACTIVHHIHSTSGHTVTLVDVLGAEVSVAYGAFVTQR